MGLMNFIRGEFIDVIEWVDETNDTLLWKFPRFQNAIKNGAQLTVRESQMAIFMDEGKFADVYGPGRYTLTTQNMPLLTTLKSWKHGFNSPFKVDVIFVNTKQFLNQKWGTKQPILLRDPEFGPIRIRAFGSFAFRVDEDPKTLITEIAGTNPDFTTEEISVQIRNFIVTRFTDAVAESKLPVLDMASNLNEYSEKIQEILKPSVSQYGLKLTTFLVENISLPEAVQEALDRRASMGIIGKENMGTYTQMQFADSMGKGGEIFVFDMGEPVKILNLATRMIKLSGYEPNVDIKLVYTGLRPGEKLYEELLSDSTKTMPTHHKKIMISKDPSMSFTEIEALTTQMYEVATQGDKTEVVLLLKQIVKEFKSNNSEYETLDKKIE